MRLVYGRDEFVALWTAHKLRVNNPNYFAPYVAIGIEHQGLLCGGAIYNNFQKTPNGEPISIEVSGAWIDKRCGVRHILRPLFEYPFSQLMVRRVQMNIAKPNMVARRFAERLGFTLEGISRQAHFTGKDAAIYSMLKHECGWISEPRFSKRAVNA